MTGIRVEFDASEVAAVAEAWKRAPDIIADELVVGVLEASLYVERQVKERTPTTTNLLRSSIGAREPRRAGDEIIGAVGTSIGYAIPVELGTKPHFPPIQALSDWARLKFGLPPEEAERVGFAVARKIAREGTKGAFMFERGIEASETVVARIIRAATQRAIDKLAQVGR